MFGVRGFRGFTLGRFRVGLGFKVGVRVQVNKILLRSGVENR